MPLPVGHSLMGYALYETVPREKEMISWRMLLLFALLANLPDIDFLPGLIRGRPNEFHHHFFTHSLGFAVVIGGILGLYFALKNGKKFWPYFLIFAGVCYSHMILDCITADTSEPFGVPMFWPFSTDYFYSPVLIFWAVQKSNSSSTFFQTLFTLPNLWVALWEIVVFIPVLTIIRMAKRKGQGAERKAVATKSVESRA